MVGGLFFTVLMVSGFSVLSLALDAQTDIVNTQRIVSDIELKKQQERFGIAVSTDTNNFLNISVTNLGQNPVGIESFWIINKTMATEPAKRFEINYDDSFVSSAASTQILTSQPLYMIPESIPEPSQSDCDVSYPDFCIPPNSPDLDCGDIPQKNFTVIQPDPHRFDGDKDGIGCEN